KHPAQEEVIYVLDGKIEQWIGEDMKQLKQGDSAFIPAGMVHASFNIDKNPATVLAILGPAVGADGYEVVDVGEEPPWINLRNPDG
ncbi:MAG: cupin domain-containing protein, partial [Saprospiraceae bacterium]|nr:cupin domain-containing protein [Saprospiraceae bacterium]